MIQKLTTDPIIDEIHQTRREMAEKFNGDYTAMLDDARRRQEASGRPLWQPKSASLPAETTDASAEVDEHGSTTTAE